MNVSNNPVVPVDGYTRWSTLGVLNNFNGGAGILIEFGGIGSASNRANIKNNSLNIGYEVARAVYNYINGRDPAIEKSSIVPSAQPRN